MKTAWIDKGDDVKCPHCGTQNVSLNRMKTGASCNVCRNCFNVRYKRQPKPKPEPVKGMSADEFQRQVQRCSPPLTYKDTPEEARFREAQIRAVEEADMAERSREKRAYEDYWNMVEQRRKED